MTTRRTLLRLIVAGLVSAASPAHPQSPGRVYRIGRLMGAPDQRFVEAFEQGLRNAGWRPGEDVLIEARDGGGKRERLPALAAELVALRVDVIVAGGDVAIEAARRATTSIPIVMAVATDPVERGFVRSLARPGGNVTGLSAFLPELAGKRLELLKEALPWAGRVGVISIPVEFHRSELGRMELAARALGLHLRPIEVKTQADLEGALSALVTAGVDAVYVQPGTSVTDPRRETLAMLALQARLPAVGALRHYAEAGFLLSYGANQLAWPRRAAYFVDRLLRGARPSDLPVEQPTEFELVVNLRTARTLGLPIPPAVLSRADEVIR